MIEATPVDVTLIRTDGGTQPRAMVSDEAVSDYAIALEGGAVFPPVTVFYDGAAYWLADGYHRFFAHRKAGLSTIQADVQQGTRRDAVLFSVGANAAHGLRRTNFDKNRAVTTLLEDEEWGQWSDTEIARRCAVSPTTVGSVRNSLSILDSESKPKARTYTTKHGKKAKMKTGNIGKKPQPAPPAPATEPEPDAAPVEDEIETDGPLVEWAAGSSEVEAWREVGVVIVAQQGDMAHNPDFFDAVIERIQELLNKGV